MNLESEIAIAEFQDAMAGLSDEEKKDLHECRRLFEVNLEAVEKKFAKKTWYPALMLFFFEQTDRVVDQ